MPPKNYLNNLANNGEIPFLLVGNSRKFNINKVRETLNTIAKETSEDTKSKQNEHPTL